MTSQPNATQLLTDVATALNACETAGIRVKLTHGAVFTSHGWVLPPVLRGQVWVAQTPSCEGGAGRESDETDDEE